MDTFNYSKAIQLALIKIQELTNARDPNGWDSRHFFASDFEAGYTYAEGSYTCYSFETREETYNYLSNVLACMQEVEEDTK